jgi:hypothetical protein
VVDLKPSAKVAKTGHAPLFSPGFTLSGGVKKNSDISDLSAYPHENVITHAIGDGIGYHGIKTFSGVPLVSLLEKIGVDKDPKTVILVTSPDGYRSILSYGELFYTTYGRRILMADGDGSAPLKKDGRFILVLPDEQAADRWVKAVGAVEILRLK